MIELPDRRRFLGTAVMTIAAAKFGMIGSADGWWDPYSFATERGRAGYDANPREFAKLLLSTPERERATARSSNGPIISKAPTEIPGC